jgi:hypothetical protein
MGPEQIAGADLQSVPSQAFQIARITTERISKHGLQIRASYRELDEVKSALASTKHF